MTDFELVPVADCAIVHPAVKKRWKGVKEVSVAHGLVVVAMVEVGRQC